MDLIIAEPWDIIIQSKIEGKSIKVMFAIDVR